jgi:pimeloyl-ACP methyl ester carboxylesterase
VRLRLYHHSDGARIAYREAGTGPPVALLHSALMSHREFMPVVEHLADRFRVVLPDLPLHGDSEDRPRHPYTLDWLADVMAGFSADVLGPRAAIGGHELGAEVLLRAVTSGRLTPGRLILLPFRVHRPLARGAWWRGWRAAARVGGLPGADRLAGHAARVALRPGMGARLSAQGDPAARDLVRHALADAGGNAHLARSWSRFASSWPSPGARREVLEELSRVHVPTLLLWADRDHAHPLAAAEQALDLLPDGLLRVLPGTGFLIAYDDPVGMARELAAFVK